MAKFRKSIPVMHLLSIAATSALLVALVGLLPPPAPPQVVAAAGLERARTGVPLRPSYIVRTAPPAVAAPAEPAPDRIWLAVRPEPVVAPSAPVTEKRYVTAGALNLRAGPSSAADQLAALPMGTAVEVSGTEGKWAEVATADGLRGWVFARYLSRTAPQ